MLNQFNKNINEIIFEAFEISPKFIDKDFQCSYNKIDLFTSKKFFRKDLNELFVGQEFLRKLNDKIKIDKINKESSFIIYIRKFSLVFSLLIVPDLCNRHEVILLNSWKSDKIPGIEVNGQKRIIFED